LFVVKIAEGDRLKLRSLARGWREWSVRSYCQMTRCPLDKGTLENCWRTW
jgi:hypothetical protein